MILQEDDCLGNQPTSRTVGFSNAMVDDILYNKIQEFIKQLGPLYQAPTEEESVNDKKFPCNISTFTGANSVPMEGIEQMFQNIF